MVQEVGVGKLQELGVNLVAADNPQSFLDDTPTSRLIRQILGAVSEFDKAMLVAKLKGASGASGRCGKCEGRKSLAELHPEFVAKRRRLRPRSTKGKRKRITARGRC